MSLILSDCIEFNEKRKKCVAYEKGKTYNLNNISNFIIRKVKVDKCLNQGIGEKRCDFLMDIEEVKRVFFIELKGGDLDKAAKQLYQTIVYLKNEFVGFRIDARIVGSGDVPNFKNNASYRKLLKEILPTSGKIISATNKTYTENI